MTRFAKPAPVAAGILQEDHVNARSEAQLSIAQERIWTAQELRPDDAAYNVTQIVQLRGKLNVPALSKALDCVVARHAVLRSVVGRSNHELVQFFRTGVQGTLRVIDLMLLTEDVRRAQVQQSISSLADTPYRLSAETPVRAVLLLETRRSATLVITVHHIAFDGWSARVLAQEACAIYESLLTGHPVSLKALPIEYADYASHQRDLLGTGSYQARLRRWRAELERASPAIVRPAATGAGPEEAASASLPYSLSRAVFSDLEHFARLNRTTVYVVMLAGLVLALPVVVQRNDALMVLPVFGRTEASHERLIGVFVNSVALTICQPHKLRFDEVLNVLRRRVPEILGTQDIPMYELLRGCWGLAREGSSVEVVTAGLALYPSSKDLWRLPHIDCECRLLEAGRSIGTIEIALTAEGDEVSGICRFKTSIVRQQQIADVLAAWTTQLLAAASSVRNARSAGGSRRL